MMRENTLKTRLREGKTAFGIMLNLPSPELVEIVGLLGFDWVFIDAEHGPMGMECCGNMVRAAESVGITPMVRMPYAEPLLINRYLDTGAMGVLFPHLKSVATAQAAVAGLKYSPLGRRGAGTGTRAADYGLRFSPQQYAEWANSETMLFGLIEDKEAVDALPEILQVEGLDGVMLGPADLSQSLGLPMQTAHPDVLKLVDRMSATVRASNKLLCVSLRGEANAVQDTQRLVDMGVPMIVTTAKYLVARGAQDILRLRGKTQKA
jgi:2-keto-3-deoxy-L-rhamnonate aldolase RhmA